ncbi:MAG TPA: hypothetical protein VGL06_14360 [Pseudonocardiaceae bacterium]|jgi:hypothetical protein
MRRRINWADVRHDDGGAALVLALVIVTVIAISLGALLSLSETSIRTTVALRGQASTAYEADGALQAAINNIRNSTVNGQSCVNSSYPNTLTMTGFGPDPATVTCTPDPASVQIQCTSLTQCNRPGSAILTLGRTVGEDGINIQQPSGSAFKVHGVVFSNSNINVVKGSLTTNTAVYARGDCTGSMQSTPTASCDYGNTSNALGNDPGYTPAVSTVPVYQPLPPCTSANSVVTFLPGYYDDAAGLSTMMAGNSPCKHSTWWFKPGTYYFDFHNDGSNPLLSSNGGDVWTVNDGYLVAGTPVDSTGKVVSTPSVPASIPGACDNPINDAKAAGVQFIFGGDSQFAVKSGQVEMCGTYSASTPPVAVYGLTTGSATTTSLTGPAGTLKPTAVTSSGAFTNATVASVATVDGQYATMTNNGNGNQSGTVTVSGYAPPTAIPAGSILTSAQLRVVHGNTAGAKQDSRSVQFTLNGGTTTTLTPPDDTGTTVYTDTFDVTSTLAQSVYNGTFTGAQAVYSASVKHKGVEQLDAIQLDLTYVAPAFRAETGCVTLGPYKGTGNATTCALVTSIDNSGNLFYVQGTTYAPNAVLDITLNNAAEQIFRFGVIARSLWVKETGSFSYTGAVIEVPDDSPGFVFSVFLSASVCQSGVSPPSCTVVNARVAYVDGDPTRPVAGSRQVSILSWSGPR